MPGHDGGICSRSACSSGPDGSTPDDSRVPTRRAHQDFSSLCRLGLSHAALNVAAAVVVAIPLAVVAAVAVAAPQSYCNHPDELTMDGEPNYCNV